MLFNSLEFAIFFPLVVILYVLLPHKYRWFWLLIASYYFYMAWNPAYIVLILLSTVIDYFCGRNMGKLPDKSKRKPYLYLSLLTNLGILVTFKYANFINDSLRELLGYTRIEYPVGPLEILLPMGISFYTFQTMSYSIDIYHGKLKPEKHFGIFSLFVSFFPQLVAGPIERARHLLPQFQQPFAFEKQRTISGLKLMLWGMFKKVVIADRLAILVNTVYQTPMEYEGMALTIATVFFAFQIYCDFSGYSDIAIGTARILGFDLMKNFDTPYSAKGIPDFWRRWHISLSSWFKDYVYIPLGGNRVMRWRWYYNIFITFVMSGLWHGAAWTFVIWGGLHGLYLIMWRVASPVIYPWFQSNSILRSAQRPLEIAFTFFLVTFAWIFFRAQSFSEASFIATHIWTPTYAEISLMYNIIQDSIRGILGMGSTGITQMIILPNGLSLGMNLADFILSIALILFMLMVETVSKSPQWQVRWDRLPTGIRWSFYYVILLMIFFFRSFESSEFIYFQF